MTEQKSSTIYQLEREDWDRNATFYRSDERSPLMQLLANRRRTFYNIEPGQRVLDLGCGAGGTVAELREAGIDAVGVDFSPSMIEMARSEHGLGEHVQCGDATALPFEDDSFDVVIADGVLHHLAVQKSLGRSLGELNRVLRPGGTLCCFDRNGSLVSRMLLALSINAKELIRIVSRSERYPSSATRSEIPFGGPRDLDAIKRSGFKAISHRNVASAPFFMSVVLLNSVQYLVSHRLRRLVESTVCRLLEPIERHLAWRWFCVERLSMFEAVHPVTSGAIRNRPEARRIGEYAMAAV